MAKAQSFSVFTPEIWSPRVSMFFKAKLVAANYFLDYSADVADGGDQVHIPKIAEGFTVYDIPVTSGEVTASNISDTSTTLQLNKWKGAALYLSDFQYKQAARQYSLRNYYGQVIAYQLAKQFDTDLLNEGANITAVVGDSASELQSTTIEKAFSIIESNSVPKEECVLFFTPKAYWLELMKIQKYYDASQFGKPTVPQGAHDLLYGVPLVITSQVPAGTAGSEGGHRNLLVHREAFVYAFQSLGGRGGVPVRIQEKESEHLRVKIIGDIIYGTKTLRPEAGVRIISKN